MALRKMRISFDIDIATLLSMLAAAHTDMSIDVFSDAPKTPKLLNGPTEARVKAPKKLPKRKTPVRVKGKGGVKIHDAMLAHFAAHSDGPVNAKALEEVVRSIGGSPNSVSPKLVAMQKVGHIKKLGRGNYSLTARGLAHHNKITGQVAAGDE